MAQELGQMAQQVAALEDQLVQSDDFVAMYEVKAKICTKAYPHDFTACPWLHPGERARRRDPRVFKYSSTLCPDVKKDKVCPRGISCPYSHNIFEYFLHPDRYRTRMCDFGEKCTRKLCFFAHTPAQLRVTAKSLAQQANNSNKAKGKNASKASSSSSSSSDLRTRDHQGASSPLCAGGAATSAGAAVQTAATGTAVDTATATVVGAAEAEVCGLLQQLNTSNVDLAALLQAVNQPGRCILSDEAAVATLKCMSKSEAQLPSAACPDAMCGAGMLAAQVAAPAGAGLPVGSAGVATAAQGSTSPQTPSALCAAGAAAIARSQQQSPIVVGCAGLSLQAAGAGMPLASAMQPQAPVLPSCSPAGLQLAGAQHQTARMLGSCGVMQAPGGCAGLQGNMVSAGLMAQQGDRPAASTALAGVAASNSDGTLQLLPFVSMQHAELFGGCRHGMCGGETAGSSGQLSLNQIVPVAKMASGSAGVVIAGAPSQVQLNPLMTDNGSQLFGLATAGNFYSGGFTSSMDTGSCSNVAPNASIASLSRNLSLMSPSSSSTVTSFEAVLSPDVMQHLALQQRQLLQTNAAAGAGLNTSTFAMPGNVLPTDGGMHALIRDSIVAAADAVQQQQLYELEVRQRQAAVLLQQQQQQQLASRAAAYNSVEPLMASPVLGLDAGSFMAPTSVLAAPNMAGFADQLLQHQGHFAVTGWRPAGCVAFPEISQAQGRGVCNMLPANIGAVPCAVGLSG